ncbi:MAG: hypothetical protein M1503_04010 [Thaumarchaeota archaeon]|nr:hypothetical protein [Nitrososphaerota archaeon]MCL5317418.1 hypothetical protein [Nitrososphaerota archaeon]
MDDRLIMLQSIEVLKDALEKKKITEDLLEILTSSITWQMRYCEHNGIPFPYEQWGERLEKIQTLLCQLSPEMKQVIKSPDYEAEPFLALIVNNNSVDTCLKAFEPN